MSGALMVSEDGASWSSLRTGEAATLMGITHNGSEFVVPGERCILHSTDGISWTSWRDTSVGYWCLYEAAWGNGTFVAVGSWGKLLTGNGGEEPTWTWRNSGVSQSLRSVAWNGTIFVAVGDAGTVITSPDGVTWTTRSLGATTSLNSVIWGEDEFIAVGGNCVYRSPDGITWTQVASFPSYTIYDVVWSGSQYLAIRYNSSGVLTSPDGETWTLSYTSGGLYKHLDLAWNGFTYVAVSQDSGAVWSTDGKRWNTLPRIPIDPSGLNIGWADTRFYIVGFSGKILRSAPNQGPAVMPVEDVTVGEGGYLYLTVTGYDPNGSVPYLQAVGLPEGANFVDKGDGTGLITWHIPYDTLEEGPPPTR